MNTALATMFVALCLPCDTPATPLPGKPPPSPAAFFPAHTYVYLQLNPSSTVAGIRQLKLAKLLEDRMLRGLLNQALKSIPPRSDPRRMLARYPFGQAIGASIAVGVVGITAKTRGSSGSPGRSYAFPKDGPFPADLFRGSLQISGDVLLVVEIEDEALFTKTLAQLLGDTLHDGEPLVPENRTIDGIEMQAWAVAGVNVDGYVYTKFVDGCFIASQSAGSVIAATKRQDQRAPSLATRADFNRFERHRGKKPAAAFLHLGLDSAIELFSPLIPRRDREEISKWGGFDYSGLQLGMGFDEGGICEWFHLALAENPRGVLLNLARLWPSAGYVEAATRRGTVYATSLTFDWAALYGAAKFVLDLFDVDTNTFAQEASETLGVDLREDLLGALGDTMGAVAVIPRHGFIPELSLVFKIRNRAKMAKLVRHVKALCSANGIPTKDFAVSGGGPRATYINLGKDVPVKPAFAMSGDKLVVSMMPLMLKSAIRKSRKTGLAAVDLMSGATSRSAEPLLSYFFDPAPMTRNVYADLLKILDSSERRLPFEATDLPSPDFVADAFARFGFRLSMDSHFMSLDLHSPAGLALPLLVGASVGAQMRQRARRSVH